MTVQQPPAPPAPAPPAPAIAGQAQGTGANVASPGMVRLEDLLGRPATQADIRAIRGRVNSLSTQLLSAQGRREEIVKELSRTTDPAVRAGLEQRLQVLDTRLATLEQEIAANSRLNAAIPPTSSTLQDARSSVSPIEGLSQGGFIAIMIVFMIFVMAPIATAFARRLWRKPAPVLPNAQLDAQGQRIERIEQAIDAVAIEVERISEGQRFVTQLLAKQREAAAIGVGEHADR